MGKPNEQAKKVYRFVFRTERCYQTLQRYRKQQISSDTFRRFERNTLKKISGGGCVHAPCKPFTISDQNISFPIPCPLEPDLKE